MKYFAIALMGAASGIKLENQYDLWGAIKPVEEMNAVVNRGSYDSTKKYVEAAMKSNPSNAGGSSYEEVDYTPEDGIPKPHWATQYWENVVKKGNGSFNDEQVAKAEKLKPEPIRIPADPKPAEGKK